MNHLAITELSTARADVSEHRSDPAHGRIRAIVRAWVHRRTLPAERHPPRASPLRRVCWPRVESTRKIRAFTTETVYCDRGHLTPWEFHHEQRHDGDRERL